MLLLGFSAYALDCAGLDTLTCEAVNDLAAMVTQANGGTPVIADTGVAARFITQGVYDDLDRVRQTASAGGCTTTVSFEGYTGGLYVGNALTGHATESGAPWRTVAGNLNRAARRFAVLDDPSGIGDLFSTYASDGWLAGNRGSDGFVAGRWIRIAGKRGAYVTLHATCDGSTPAHEALADLFGGPLRFAPSEADLDGDGLSAAQEVAGTVSGWATDPHDPDTDGDGTNDLLDPVPTYAACSTELFFYDDFSTDPEASWLVDSGTWSWDGSSVWSNTNSVPAANVWKGPQAWTDQVAIVRMRIPSGNGCGDAGATVRQTVANTDLDNGAWHYGGVRPGNGFGVIGYVESSTWNPLGLAATTSPAEDTWFEIEVGAVDDTYTLAVDGVDLLSGTAFVYPSGGIGLRSIYCPVDYDWVIGCR